MDEFTGITLCILETPVKTQMKCRVIQSAVLYLLYNYDCMGKTIRPNKKKSMFPVTWGKN